MGGGTPIARSCGSRCVPFPPPKQNGTIRKQGATRVREVERACQTAVSLRHGWRSAVGPDPRVRQRSDEIHDRVYLVTRRRHATLRSQPRHEWATAAQMRCRAALMTQGARRSRRGWYVAPTGGNRLRPCRLCDTVCAVDGGCW